MTQITFQRDTAQFKKGDTVDASTINPKVVARFLESGRAVEAGKTKPAKKEKQDGGGQHAKQAE